MSTGILARDDLERFEHGFVETGVGGVDGGADFEVGGGGEHGLEGEGEGGEDADEADNALALVDLDFGVFNGAYLVVEESVEEAQESDVELLQCAG